MALNRSFTVHLVIVFLGELWRASAECHRYVNCRTGGEGLGDQLEHYIYCVHAGVLLDATVIIEGFEDSGHVVASGAQHEYRDVARLLGIDLNETVAAKKLLNVSFAEVGISLSQILALRDAVRSGVSELPCNVIFVSDIRSCDFEGDDWCDNGPTFDAFRNTYKRLRRNNAKRDCLSRGAGFLDRGPSGSALNIAWHIRTGDRCLHCNNVTYFTGVYQKLLEVPMLSNSHTLAIDSTDPVTWLWKDSLFGNRTIFHTNEKVVASVCRFITADILVTSGSSFAPMIAAFLPPQSPIILEEQRKEVRGRSKVPFATHFFRESEAVLMDEGVIRMGDADFIALLDSILREKVVREKQYSSGSCNTSEHNVD